ncbi:dockerin type I repeat-containing protein [bacterium]|nr:dockerin type I repeat-containing protein [bacterium]
MSRYISPLVLLLALCLTTADSSAAPRIGRAERVGDIPLNEIRSNRSLTAADTCIVRSDDGIIMRIDGWVIGEEIYKQYLDPAQSCENAYPFSVLEINMPMIFEDTGTVILSVDIEDVDLTDPGCPVPGNLIDSSSWWQYFIPAPGLYDIWVPLDSPVVVDGPFFAGFLISNPLTMSAAVLTDTSRIPCVSYNLWDTEIGFVDLGQYSYGSFDWPGRLVLYASGIPGGESSGEEPAPQIEWVSPTNDDTVLYGATELWAIETSGSSIINYVIFEYSSGGSYQDLGLVFDGSATNRNGVDPAVTSVGYSVPWNFSNLAEGTYTIRVTALDTLGRTASATRTIVLEPTPPIPQMVNPRNWDTFCSSINFLINCPDEDISFMEFKGRAVPDDYGIGLFALDQTLLGDTDADPYDGNSIADGEFGEYYSGPAAAAVAVQEWSDRGYTGLMHAGASTLGIADVAESLAVLFNTRVDRGTRDDRLVHGLTRWTAEHGDQLSVDYLRNPDYVDLRTWVQDQERVVLLGLGGSPGIWVTVDGFLEWSSGGDSYVMSVMNPMTGTIDDVTFRETGSPEIFISGSWHPVDIMVSLLADDWQITRAILGVDLDGSNGWSLHWTPNPLSEGDYFFMHAKATDASQHTAHSSVIMQYTCENTYDPGDYNNDGTTDVVDLQYLIQFVTSGGPAPIGGPQRADANCDTYINITDIVYYMNFLYGSSNDPCY